VYVVCNNGVCIKRGIKMGQLDLADMALLYKLNKLTEQIDKLSLDCRLEDDINKRNIITNEIERLKKQRMDLIWTFVYVTLGLFGAMIILTIIIMSSV
jgi:hypothetical protein